MSKCLNFIPALAVCAMLTGCASLPAPPAETQRQAWGAQVIAFARYAPQSNFRPFAIGHKQSIARGAATGSAIGLATAEIFAAGSALASVVAPYLAVMAVPVFTTAGAIAGQGEAISEQDAATLEGHIQQNLAELKVPAALAQAIADTAQEDAGWNSPVISAGPSEPDKSPDYQAHGQQGIGSVVEVRVPEVGFTGGKQLYFYLVARIRVIRVEDAAQVYEREFIYQSDAYPAQRWSENQAELFAAELQRSYQSLAESVVEQLYLLTPLPLESVAAAGNVAGMQDYIGSRDACGLAWTSPARDYHPNISDTQQRNWNRFPKLSTLQPELAWEAFPRDIDRSGTYTDELAGISRVRYDLRVWQAAADAPPTLIYERRDLPTPSYVLEKPLTAGQQYFWSARARFELNRRIHGTKWGYFRTPYYAISGRDKLKAQVSSGTVMGVFMAGIAPRDPCTLDFTPGKNYYRFEIAK